MNIFNELLLVGASQGILLSIVILSLRSTNALANRLLALFVALESLHLFFLYAVYSFANHIPSLQIRILFGLRVLDAPALYLYVRALTEYRFRFERSLLKHFWVLLPAALFSTYLTYHVDWSKTSALTLQYDNATVSWSLYHSVIFAGYGLYALQRLNEHLRRMEQALSSLESISLRWLRRLLIAVVAADVLNIGYDILRFYQVLGPQPKIALTLMSTLAMIYWLSIGGLRQQAIFTEPVRSALAAIDGIQPPSATSDGAQATTACGDGADKDTGPCDAAAPIGKLAKSGLDPDSIEAIWQQLQKLMTTQRPYLDPLLDLPRLARQLNRRPQELSLVINSRSGGSFYELINSHRVEAAKQMLRDSKTQRRKMLDIALSVGFSSVSTFYSQFKKSTGVTPSTYRDQ